MSHNRESSVGWITLLTGKNLFYSFLLTLGIFLDGINTYITTTMLPSIVKDIGGMNLYAWNMTLFILFAIVSSCCTGIILKKTGPRIAHTFAGSIFFAGSLIATFAHNMETLIVARAIQGIGAGMILALCYSMITLFFSERLWSLVMALLSGVYGIATFFGPAIGGIFAEMGSWRIGFASMLPVIFIYIILMYAAMPRRKETALSKDSLPFMQLLLMAGAILSISISSLSSILYWNILGVLISFFFLFVFCKYENRASSETKLFPHGSCERSTPLSAVFLTMALFLVCVSCEIFFPYYLQNLYNQSPLNAGYITAVISLGWVLSEIVSSLWTEENRIVKTIRYSPILLIVGMLILTFTLPSVSSNKFIMLNVICFSLFLIGAGIGTSWPHISAFVLQMTYKSDKEKAGPALATVQMFALAFGSALAGTITNAAGINRYSGVEGTALSALYMLITFSLIAVLALLSAWRLANFRENNRPG